MMIFVRKKTLFLERKTNFPFVKKTKWIVLRFFGG